MQHSSAMRRLQWAAAASALSLVLMAGEAGAQQQVVPSNLMKAENLVGRDVRLQQAQDEYGQIEDLVLDRNGQVRYLIIARGGFLNIGDELVAVPWQVAMPTLQKDVVRLNVNENVLANAPRLNRDELESDIAAVDWQEVNQYYGAGGAMQRQLAQTQERQRQTTRQRLQTRQPRVTVNTLDLDGDGAVTRQELLTTSRLVRRMNQQFNNIDADSSGAIERAEFAQFEQSALSRGTGGGMMQDGQQTPGAPQQY